MQEFDARTPTPAHETAVGCLHADVEAIPPDHVIHESVSLDGNTLTIADETYDLGACDRIPIVGGGKTGDDVANVLEAALGDRIDDGVVVAPDPTPNSDGRIERLPSDHPVPSVCGVENTRRLMDLPSDLDDRTFALAAITGDTSVVLPAPAEGISFAELQGTTGRLLKSGAEIHDLNTVRKHISTLKGGGLT